ncbi:MAG: hypothetical protein AABY22_28510 [Nanoarchaeota archaeon]
MSKPKKLKSKHSFVGVVILNRFEILPVLYEQIFPITSSFQDEPWHNIAVLYKGMEVLCEKSTVIFPDSPIKKSKAKSRDAI